MLRHKNIDKICFIVLALSIMLTLVFMNAEKLGFTEGVNTSKYEYQLFGELAVNSIDITVDEDEWQDMLDNASDKEYIDCTIEINGEKFINIAIRPKGNSSLQKVQSSTSDRYSFKIEFDHYDSSQSYHGLDKLCLNNIIQDNTFMKEYLIYTLMDEMGVPSPLVNYASVTVNGEEFGLYLAVEAIEEAFLQRNYGTQYGNAYKPESENQMAGKGSTGTTTTLSSAFGYDGTDVGNYGYIFDNAVTNISNSDKEKLIESIEQLNEGVDLEEVIDIEEVIRYFVVHNFALNYDSYTGAIMHNYYVYEDNGVISVLPWDYNLAFASFMTTYSTEAMANFPIDTPVSTGTVESRPLLAWIFENEEYTQMYHEIFAEMMETLFVSGEMYDLLDDIEELITPYVEADDTKFCTFEEYQEGVVALDEFLAYRVESIQGQLNGTIPSTAEGQELYPETLISTGSLDMTKTGSENAGQSSGGMSQGGQMGGQSSGKGEGQSMGGRGDKGTTTSEIPTMFDTTTITQIFDTLDSDTIEKIYEIVEGNTLEEVVANLDMSTVMSVMALLDDETIASIMETMNSSGMQGMMPSEGMGEIPPMMEGQEGMGEMPPMMEGQEGMGEMPPMMEGQEGMGEMPPMMEGQEAMGEEMSQGGQMNQGGGMNRGDEMSQGGMNSGTTSSGFDMATIIWLFSSIMVMLIALLAITSYKRR